MGGPLMHPDDLRYYLENGSLYRVFYSATV